MNKLVPVIGDNAANEKTSLTKTGVGTWILSPDNGITNGVTGNITQSSPIITTANTSNLSVGQQVTGNGLPAGSYVTAFTKGNLTLATSALNGTSVLTVASTADV